MSVFIQVTGFRMVGGAYRRGMYDAGYVLIYTSDGKQKYYGEKTSLNEALANMKRLGFNTSRMETRLDMWVKTGAIPPHEDNAEVNPAIGV